MSWGDMREQQRLLEAQRLLRLNPRFEPAVDGVLWNRARVEDRPRVPILSVLEFKFKPGIDLRDVSGAPRKFWDISVEYIWSIPGCNSLEWGPTLEDSTIVLCTIQWEDAGAWQRFQESLGFSLVIGLLAENVSNRCSKLSPLDTPPVGDQRTILEVISVTFDSDIPPEYKTAFEQEWATLIAPSYSGRLPSDRAGWLEHNGSKFAEPTADDIAASRSSTTFIGLLAWLSTGYDSHAMTLPCKDIRDRATPGIKRDLSRRAVELVKESRRHDVGPLPPPTTPADSFAAILETGFRRQLSGEPNLMRRASQAVADSIQEMRQGRQRLFPVARGFFSQQGQICQDNMPAIRGLDDGGDAGGHFIVDLVWLKLKPDLPGQERDIFRELDGQISQLSGYDHAFWARALEETATIAILTAWEDQTARAASIQQYHEILNSFAASSRHLRAPLTHQAFPWRRTMLGLLSFQDWRQTELISFDVSCGVLDRQLFEKAYGDFQRIMQPTDIAGTPIAGFFTANPGWLSSELLGPGHEMEDMQRFIGVASWESQAARLEWYGYLFRARTEYELFGHKLDALKTLATGGVKSRFFALQLERSSLDSLFSSYRRSTGQWP